MFVFVCLIVQTNPQMNERKLKRLPLRKLRKLRAKIYHRPFIPLQALLQLIQGQQY